MYRGTTLRGPLTGLYGALLAFALALYAVVSAFYFLHTLILQIDTVLSRNIETVEALLMLQPGGQLAFRSHEGEAHAREHDPGYLLEVWSSDSRLLYRSAALDDHSLGPVPGQTGSSENPHSLWLADGREVRVMTRSDSL
jgi:hypothetical protein